MDDGQTQVREGALFIDCRSCPGRKDLADQDCMRCALKALARAPGFDRLVLSGSLDVAYEGACVQVLRDLAEAVRLCSQELPSAVERSCSDCGGRPALVLGRIADSIPYLWEGQVAKLRPAQARAKCISCCEKVNDVQSAVTAKLRQIEHASSREAFMVVGESGDA